MKALICCVPQAGHVNPLLPVVRALMAAGHDVTVASAAAVAGAFAPTDAVFREVGSPMERWFAGLAARTRGAPGDGLPPGRILPYFVPRLFAEVGAADVVDGLLELASDLRPDLIVHDTEHFAAPLVAELVGARSLNHQIGPLLPEDVLTLANDAVSPLWRSFDRDAPGWGGVYRDLTVAICPPSLDPAAAAAGRLLRMSPTAPPGPARPQHPRLAYVSFGTVWANPQLVRTVVEGLAEHPVRVLVTTGGLAPADVGPVPANVRVEQFVPQQEVLPGCSIVVHHGGGGTMFGALAHGLAQVVLPQAADNYVNAALLDRAGVAVVLRPEEVSVDAVRAAVGRVLSEPAFAAAAEWIARELAALPSPAELVAQLAAEIGG